MAYTRRSGARVPGGYPTGLRGAVSVTCPVETCQARVGVRCAFYTKDRDGRPVFCRYRAKPHPERVARAKGQTP